MVNHTEKWKLNELVCVVNELDSTISDTVNESNLKFSHDDVCCKRCISNASNTTYSQLICGRMI